MMNKEFLDSLIRKSDLDNKSYNENKILKNNDISFYIKDKPDFKNYIVLDFETTGLSPFNDKIVEIGAIKVEDNKIIDKFEMLINPKIAIPSHVSKIINITNNMVADKPSIDQIFKSFVDFLGDFNLVIHNAKFDMGFLIVNGENLGFNIKNKALDTISVTKDLFPDLKKYNLASLCKHFKIENKNAHRAMSDVLATYELYKILYDKYNKKQISLFDM